MTLGAGIDYLDLEFLGQAGIIATAVLHGRQGVAIVDPGPSTCLPVLTSTLTRRGFSLTDVRAILLTHIHLDHAGATGVLVDQCPNAEVFVHHRGARHIVDPAKLLASASRLYGDDMDRLWGEVRPVPESAVRTLEDGGRLDIVGHQIEFAWTPGHASHHVSYHLPAARLAFVGDVAGIARQGGRLVIPPTPPPDIDLEAWRRSTQQVLAWDPDVLFLTHFGPHRSPRVHMQELWRSLDDWSQRVRASLAEPGTDQDRTRAFVGQVMNEIARTASQDEAQAYANAARLEYSWAGLARYWRSR